MITDEQLLAQFIPPVGFQLEDFYGVSMYTNQKDNTFTVKLQYEYSSTTGKTKFSRNGITVPTVKLLGQLIQRLVPLGVDKSDNIIESLDDLLPR